MKKKHAIVNDQGKVFYLTDNREFAEFTVKLLNESGEKHRIVDAEYYQNNKGKYRKRKSS